MILIAMFGYKQFSCVIHFANYTGNLFNREKGDNTSTAEEIKQYYLFEGNVESNIDVTIIIGINHNKENNDTTGSLLLMRFHKFNPILSRRKKQTTQKLFDDITSLLKNDGLERRRMGGSSCFIKYSKNLKVLMKSHNSSPRVAKGKSNKLIK